MSQRQIFLSMLEEIICGLSVFVITEVTVKILKKPQAIKAAEGVGLELDDCAFPCLSDINCYDQAEQAFDGTNWALLIGSMPRKAGMERSDLIKSNGPIFVEQGKALRKAASKI